MYLCVPPPQAHLWKLRRKSDSDPDELFFLLNYLHHQVVRATLPITRCLVRGSDGGKYGEHATVLALNQLFELAQARVSPIYTRQ